MKKKQDTQPKDDLLQKLEAAEQNYRRAQADYHNLEMRTAKHVEEHTERVKARLLTKIIELIDDMEQASTFITDEGLQLILQKAKTILDQEGIQEIDALGKPFDPYSSECLELVDGPNPDNVAEIVQKGYKTQERVIRPARVKVTKQK